MRPRGMNWSTGKSSAGMPSSSSSFLCAAFLTPDYKEGKELLLIIAKKNEMVMLQVNIAEYQGNFRQ